VTPSGTVSTFVSSGLDEPYGLAFDAAGNLYVANFGNNTISKVTPAGVVSTFVNSGLDGPDALAFDAEGNLYVGNGFGWTISKVTPSGAVSTFASGLECPKGLAFDAAGSLYVANYNNSTICKVTSSGAVSTFAAGGLDQPVSLAFDAAGNLYVANLPNNTISKVTPSGAVSTFVSSGLLEPEGLAFDAAGSLYVANYGNNTISKIAPPVLHAGKPFNSTIFRFTDSDPQATASDYTAVVTLGDGNSVTLASSGVVTGPAGASGKIIADPNGGFDVQLSYTYAESLSNRTFAVQVTELGGASTSASDSTFNVAPTVPTATTVSESQPSVTYGTPVTFTATVAAQTGSTAPTAGSVDFYDSTASCDLGTGNLEISSGTTSVWTLTTGVKAFNATTGDTITATYTPGPGFASSGGAISQVVTPLPITVTAATNTKTYDGTTSAAAVPAITSGSLVAGDIAAFIESYTTAAAGMGMTLTPAGSVSDGNGGNNYTVSFVASAMGAITPKPLTATITADSKTYDGTTTAVTHATLGGGVIGSDQVSLVDGAGTFASRNAGTWTVTDTGLSLSGADAGNYTVNGTATATASITPGAITVAAVSGEKVYDGTTVATAIPTITGGNLATGDTAAFSETFDSKNVGSGKTLTVAGSANDGNAGANYAVVSVTNTAGSISPRAITVAATASTRVYDGTTASTAAPTITGGKLATGDTTAFSETFDNKNVGSGKTLAAVGSVNDGNGGNNYTVTFGTATGAIEPRPITVTAAASSKVYDGTTTATAAPTVSSGGLAAGDTAAFGETFDNRNIGFGKVLTAAGSVNDGNGGNNYAVSFSNQASGQVTPRAITVTVVAATKTYDGTTASTAAPTVSSGGLVTGDTAGFTETFDTRNAGSGKRLTPAGSVNDGNGGANYLATFVANATGSIAARAITVAAANSTKGYDGDTSSTAVPMVTGGSLVAGDVADFSETFDNRNAGSGKTLTAAGWVEDDNDGNNYAVTFTANTGGSITPQPLTITAVAGTKVYDDTTASTSMPTVTGGGIISGDTAVFSESFTNKNAGSGKTLNATGSVSDGNGGNNYAVTFAANTTGSITPRAITVTAVTSGKVYDGTTSSTAMPTVTGGSLVTGDAAAFSESFDTRNAGSGKTLTVAGSVNDGNGGANYAVTKAANITGSIAVRSILVAAVAATRIYDGTTASTAVPTLVSGSVAGGDTAAFVETFDTKNVGGGKVLTATGSVNDGNGGNNYTVFFATNTGGSITARAITVTAAICTKGYDGTISSTGVPAVSAPGLACGDMAVFGESYQSKNAGPNTLVPAGSVRDGDNGADYAVAFAAVTGSITARAITVTLAAVSKGYDGTTSTTTAPTITAGSLASGDTAAFSEAFSDKNAGSGKTLVLAGSVNDGNGGANYAVTAAANTHGSISARAITVTAISVTKTYDGAASATAVPAISAPGLAGGDTPAFTESFTNRNAGAGKTLTVAGSVNDGNGGADYAVTVVAIASGSIAPKSIIVTAAASTKAYDGTASSTAVPTVSGLVGGDTAAFSESFDSRNAGMGKTLLLAGSVNDGNGGNNYAATLNPNASGVINRRPITVMAAAATKGYDGTIASTALPAITGGSLVAGDTAAFIETFNTKNVGAGKTLTAGGSVNDGNGGDNYVVTGVDNAAGSITVRAISVTAVSQTKVYDGTTSATGVPAVTGGSLAAGDAAAFSEYYSSASVGTGLTLTPAGSVNDGNGGNNYAVTFDSDATGAIVARPNTPYISLGNGGIGNYIVGQNARVQIPVRVDNLQDAAGDVGLDYATVQLSFSSSASIASPAKNGATESGNTVTITTQAAQNFAVGQSVSISGVVDSRYDGTSYITSVTGTTFTYTLPAYANLPASGSGTAVASFFDQGVPNSGGNAPQVIAGPLASSSGWTFTPGLGNGVLRIAANSDNAANDITTSDPTDGGTVPDGDILVYVGLHVVAGTSPISNIPITVVDSSTSLVEDTASLNQTQNANYPTLSADVNATVQVVVDGTAPTAELSVNTSSLGTVSAGGSYSVPVVLTPVTPGGPGVSSANADILFDPNYIDPNSISVSAGNLLTNSWTVNYGVAKGQFNGAPSIDTAAITMSAVERYSSGGIANLASNSTGSVWVLHFTTMPGVSGSTVLNLVPDALPALPVATNVQDGSSSYSQYALSPAPTEGLSDQVDGTINVTRAVGHFPVTASPASVAAGKNFMLAVTAEDGQGNVVTDYGGTVQFSSSDPLEPHPGGNLTFTPGSGVAYALASLETAGSWTITAADTENPAIQGSSAPVTVTAASATAVVFSQPPAGTSAGATIPVMAEVVDPYGNLVGSGSGSTSDVTLAIASGPSGGKLLGTTTVQAVGGVATFGALSIDQAGLYVLTASAAGVGGTATSGSFNVAAGAAARLAFTTEPANTPGANAMASVKVAIEDQYGNTVTTDSSSVTLSLNAAVSGGGVLKGATTASAQNGVATFSGLSIVNSSNSNWSAAGTGYSLTASDTDAGVTLTAGKSAAFNTTFVVTSCTMTPTGFVATFSQPFEVATTPVVIGPNLYSAAATGNLPVNVSLIGSTEGTVRGSLVLNATDTQITFVATTLVHSTGLPIAGVSSPDATSGILAPGGYTVVLDSTNTSFVTTNGQLLDGADRGVGGSNFNLSTVVNNSADVDVVIPSFARGPSSSTVTSTVNVLNASTPIFAATAIPIASSAKSGATESGNTVTITTTAAHGLVAGQTVTIANVTNANYDGTFTVASVLSTTSFNYVDALYSNLSKSGGGMVTGYGLTESGSTVTVWTTAASELAVGQPVTISGAGVAGYNGTFTVTSLPGGANGTTFTYTDTNAGLANSGGGIAALARGIPISLSGPTGGVTSGTFTLTYSSSDLAISGAVVDPSLAASYGATLSLDASSTAGNAIIDFKTTTPLPTAGSTPILLGGLMATVPSTAYYKAKDLLHFSGVSLSTATGSVPTIGSDALHLVTFPGDASGDGTITSADVLDMARVVAGADAGFAACPLVDPDVIGDLLGDGTVDGPDGALLGRYVNGVTTPQVPVYPGTPVNKLSVVGSTVSIPSALQLGVGGNVTASVTVVDTALPVLPQLTTNVVAGPVAPVSAGATVKGLGGVSLHFGASAVPAHVSEHVADGLFAALGDAVDAAELAVLGSGTEQAVGQALAAQMSAAGSAQANLDSLLWESEDSSWLDGEQDWLL
jgi:hypothetical protein